MDRALRQGAACHKATGGTERVSEKEFGVPKGRMQQNVASSFFDILKKGSKKSASIQMTHYDTNCYIMLKNICKCDRISAQGESVRFIKEKRGNHMSHFSENHSVCYYVLEGSRYLFADERNKKKLLDIVRAVQRVQDWHIYAFCLMDDDAYFIIESKQGSQVCTDIRLIVASFLDECGSCLWSPRQAGVSVISSQLASMEEIAYRCRDIHLLPCRRGRVQRVIDYWWSRYITYAGVYDWGMVDQSWLADCFGGSAANLQREFRRFHSDKECSLLYKTNEN